MAKLKLADPNIAALFSFAPTCETTEAALQDLLGKNWNEIEARKHIDAAIAAGAYIKEVKYPTRSERVVRAGGAQGVETDGR